MACLTRGRRKLFKRPFHSCRIYGTFRSRVRGRGGFRVIIWGEGEIHQKGPIFMRALVDPSRDSEGGSHYVILLFSNFILLDIVKVFVGYQSSQ